jgi:hypothetical protein
MAEEQLATYAFGQGVPLVVLTSGADWHFYAPYGPGLFKDRRIHRLDLTERTAEDAAERFKRYLSYDAWLKGTASVSVQSDLQEMLGKQETRRRLPEAWEALVSEPHPQLVDLLAAELERMTGSEPPRSEVISYIIGQALTKLPIFKSATKLKTDTVANPKTGSNAMPMTTGNAKSALKLWINGTEIPVSKHQERFILVLDHLAQKDRTILERLHEAVPSGRRPTVARTPEGLYPKNPEFATKVKTAWRELPSAEGWYIDVNKSAASMLSYIKMACDMAGVRLGEEIVID